MKKASNSNIDNNKVVKEQEIIIKKLSAMSEYENSQEDQSLRQSRAIQRKVLINDQLLQKLQPKLQNEYCENDNKFATPKKRSKEAQNQNNALDQKLNINASTAIGKKQLSNSNYHNVPDQVNNSQSLFFNLPLRYQIDSGIDNAISDQFAEQNRKLKILKQSISIEMSKMSKVITEICHTNFEKPAKQGSWSTITGAVQQQKEPVLKQNIEIQKYEQLLRAKDNQLQLKIKQCNQNKVELEQVKKDIAQTMMKAKRESELALKLATDVCELEKKVKNLSNQTGQTTQEYEQRQMKLQNQISQLNGISKDFMELLQAKNHIIGELEKNIEELKVNQKNQVSKDVNIYTQQNEHLKQICFKLEAKIKQQQQSILGMSSKLESSVQQLNNDKQYICSLQTQVKAHIIQKQTLNNAITQCNHGILSLETKHKRIVDDLNGMIRDLNHKNKHLQEETAIISSEHAKKQKLVSEYEQKIFELTTKISNGKSEQESQYNIASSQQIEEVSKISKRIDQHSLINIQKISVLLSNEQRKCKQLELILHELMALDRAKQKQIELLNDEITKITLRYNKLVQEFDQLNSRLDKQEQINSENIYKLNQIMQELDANLITNVSSQNIFKHIIEAIYKLKHLYEQKQKQNEQIIEELVNNQSQFRVKCQQNQKIINLCRQLIVTLPVDTRPQFESMLQKLIPKRVRTQ